MMFPLPSVRLVQAFNYDPKEWILKHANLDCYTRHFPAFNYDPKEWILKLAEHTEPHGHVFSFQLRSKRVDTETTRDGHDNYDRPQFFTTIQQSGC